MLPFWGFVCLIGVEQVATHNEESVLTGSSSQKWSSFERQKAIFVLLECMR